MFQKILHTLLDFFLPQNAVEKKLETLTPEAWRVQVATAEPLGGSFTALAAYKDPLVRQSVWALKYRGSPHAARIAGALLHEELLALLSDIHVYDSETSVIIVPIPASAKRQRERGHNQALLLAHELLDVQTQQRCTLCDTALTRTRDTVSQTKLSRAKRLDNMKGVFVVPKDKRDVVYNAIVIIIDDVITTGATMADAHRALREAGARDVYGLALAH